MEYITVPFEVKELAETGRFSGIANAYGVRDLQDDIVEPGAFKAWLQEKDSRGVPILMAHQTGRVVGFSTALSEAPSGLAVEAEFTIRATDGRDAYELTKHAQRAGQPFGLSVGYEVRPDGARMEAGIRRLSALNLFEISLAAVPANPQARVSAVKSAAAAAVIEDLAECKTPADVTRLLRSVGMSRKRAGDWLNMVRTGEDEPEEPESTPADIAKAFKHNRELDQARLQFIEAFARSLHPEPPRSRFWTRSLEGEEIREKSIEAMATKIVGAIALCKDRGEVERMLHTIGLPDDFIVDFKQKGFC